MDIQVKDDLISEASQLKVTVSLPVTTIVTKDYTLQELDRLIDQYTSTINGETQELARLKDLRDSVRPEVDKAISLRPQLAETSTEVIN